MGDQVILDQVDALNQQPRCACVLLLDTSGSMAGDRAKGHCPVEALNEGVKAFAETLKADSVGSQRVEVAVVTFDSSVTVQQDFVTVDRFEPPTLTAQGQTAMGAGILKALEMIQERKAEYKKLGLPYFRPWVFMLTDGGPTDAEVMPQAISRVQEDERANRVAFFAVGVEGADMTTLGKVSVRQPISLRGLNFKEMFVWLSASMKAVAQSKPGDMVALPPPSGWGQV